MSIVKVESFGQMADGSHADGSGDFAGEVWSNQNGAHTITDLGGGRKKCRCSYYGGYLDMPVSGGPSTVLIHLKLHRYADAGSIVWLYDGAELMGGWNLNSDGTVSYYRNPPTTSEEVLRSTRGVDVGNTVHLVLKVTLHQSAGAVEIFWNGVSDGSVSSVDTIAGGTTLDLLRWISYQANDKIEYSDVIIDTATNHGAAEVAYDPCDTSGSSSDFTATGDTNNEDCVDEIGPDDDTTYNRSTTSTDLDQLTHSGLSGVQAVIAVAPIVRARKEAGGTDKLKLGTLHSGTHGQGSDKGLSEDYEYYIDIFEDVPGGSGWTPTQLNNAETSYQNTT